MKKFPDFVPPTKVAFLGQGATLHLRRCVIATVDSPMQEWSFEKDEIRIGSMDDNDIVLADETVSRYHAKIVQEDQGYVLVDQRSTNGTFLDNVRIREAYIKPGSTLMVGQTALHFQAQDEEVRIAPSVATRCGRLIGGNARMRQLYAIIEKIAPTATTVVIEGETGTGKEVVAQSLHDLSSRAKGPMVVFDCSAVPPNLVESELFGHEKGSFTGALVTRQGLFELADGGTLFLDELGELPIDLQPKLLRVLEQREVRRVGGAKASKVDVRIIAATNRNLEAEVKAGRFRQDLFYRLSVVRLQLPPLRERADDIPMLVEHLLKSGHFNRGTNGNPRVRTIDAAAIAALQAYPWPGNVRELVNCIERAVSFADGANLTVTSLPENVRAGLPARQSGEVKKRPSNQVAREPAPAGSMRPPEELLADNVPFKDAKERWIASFERDYIETLLRRNGGNISHAAREADIDRKYYRKLMRKYGIEAADVTDDDDE